MKEQLTNPELVGKEKPASCRERLRLEGKPYPRSGCDSCHMGGMLGCPYDKQRPTGEHQFQRPPRREGPPDVSTMKWDQKEAAMKLWREHGGSVHGPNVETVTMPQNAFWSFLEAYIDLTHDRDR